MTAQPATTTSTEMAAPTRRAPRPSTVQRLVTPVVAVGAALTAWALASAATPVEVVSAGGAVEPVGAAAVIGASTAAALAGWAVLALLERFAGQRARATWLVGAALLLAGSMVPLVLPGGTPGGARLALAAVHVVVFAVVVVGLLRPLGGRTAGPA